MWHFILFYSFVLDCFEIYLSIHFPYVGVPESCCSLRMAMCCKNLHSAILGHHYTTITNFCPVLELQTICFCVPIKFIYFSLYVTHFVRNLNKLVCHPFYSKLEQVGEADRHNLTLVKWFPFSSI